MSVQKEISARLPAKEGRNTEELSAVVFVDMAETIEEAVEMFGEEAILTNAFSNWRVTLQGNIRGALGRGEDPDTIADRLSTAKMGVAQTGGRVDPQAAFLAKFKNATQEEQAEMLDALKAAAQG